MTITQLPVEAAVSPIPTFHEFYRAVNTQVNPHKSGLDRYAVRDPFPWQQRLADHVARDEEWPVEIGVQTGLGKTSCLEIAVWWLASQAHRSPAKRTAPTRIWWVVNRRLLVDSTAEHAQTIAKRLEKPTEADVPETARKTLAAVAERLRELPADPKGVPLEVIRLRGGVAAKTPTDPSQPAIVLCTLPMYGSRLLFRGYGSGSRLRTVDAAMAGTDSLVLLDEAHLAPHLKSLLPALAECTPGAQPILAQARERPTLVSLTATGDAANSERFELDEEDRAHPIVLQRLDAVKPLELRTAAGDVARRLAEATLDLIGQAPAPAGCVVFANTPKTARETFDRLRKKYAEGAVELLLLTGLSREREAERVRERILHKKDGMAAAREETTKRERHLIVVATQTLEVGADVDAEYLVTEACGVRALTQRLGRLNRLGRYDHARAVYVHVPPPKSRSGRKTGSQDSDTWPVYGAEPATLLERLQDARGGLDGTVVNLSPRRVASVLGAPQDVPSRAPEVLPGILWEWTKTTTPPHGEAPVDPYFAGIGGAEYSVSLLWRVHVPNARYRLWPRATDREAVGVLVEEVRRTIGDEYVHRLEPDGVTVERTPAAELRPGDQIVLPSDRGLLDEFGWNPDASDPVVDVSIVGQGLPLDTTGAGIKRLCGVELEKARIKTALGITDEDGAEIGHDEQREAVEAILTAVRTAPTPTGWDEAEWASFTGSLTPPVVDARREVSRLRVRKQARETHVSDLDETSLVCRAAHVASAGAAALELDRHGQAVAARAATIAHRIGLERDLIEVVERAGALHDVGKAERRFQRWLDPLGKRGVLVAKSEAPRDRWEEMRADAGWPRGGRHEDLSARLVRAWLEQVSTWDDPMLRDLLVHLVVSHHGKGRPLVPPVADGTPAMVRGKVAGASVQAPADLAVVDWDQPARFRRLNDHFGPWGLALLEALVIRADHAVSGGAEVELEAAQ